MGRHLLSGGFIILLLLLLIITDAKAQRNKASHWYFPYLSGVDFTQNPPVPTDYGKTDEIDRGTAIISDNTGQLLFYTDGHRVWNRNHQRMPNGSGLTKGEVQTSLQSSLIVPRPGSETLFYIFTTNPGHGLVEQGLFYAVVDMSRRSGLGDVIQKHVPLHNPVTGSLTAVQHANGKDYWVIAHEYDSGKYLAYLVTASGVQASPVISELPSIQREYPGQMKAAPDGSRIVVPADAGAEISDFNTRTGKLSNPYVLQRNPYAWVSGLEFSPNSTLLYVANANQAIYQYDLNKNTWAEVEASGYQVGGWGFTNIIHDLQLAPDGRIYAAKGGGQGWGATYLGVISNPNGLRNQASFDEKGFPLVSPVDQRLPMFVTSYLANPAAISYANHCLGETTVFRAAGIGSRDALLWNFGDPASGGANTSTDLAATHTFSSPGTYTVSLQVTLGDQVKTHQVQVTIHAKPAVDLGSDISVCEGTDITMDAGAGTDFTYLWSTGETTQKIAPTSAGSYWVEVSNGYCTARDEIEVTITAKPGLELGPDRTLCENTPVLLSAGGANQGYSVLWSTGQSTPDITVTKPGLYWVEVTNGVCLVRDEITINYIGLKDLSIAAANDTLSYQEPLYLEAVGTDLVSWSWDLGDGTTSRTANPIHQYAYAGTYNVTLHSTNKNGCPATSEKEIVVKPHLFIPNIFTPNNDGKNDVFRVEYNGRGAFEVQLYNRWGKQVYQASTKDFAWSGEGFPAGVYFYLIKTETGTYKGSVTLVK
ncbi:PKD domain-containing protein [Pontibacter virosus]|uniref:Gliding motility-associated-like protein/predicted secreted protein (Por secretion system target) n=1 Tax=Pontibacter virosus TaxID=1765052 RepID=A0A2U1ATK0_9BACT|nr:PKD domain-containing protein [Pontibacter virosus]PVY39722.1 gliding motility-associated-like protein/predicted secreted protein (Por secretion system target) [Pontibacter virosus]